MRWLLLLALAAPAAYGPVKRIALLEDKAIFESSGIAASRRTPGVYWTHNDNPDLILYAFDLSGKKRGRVLVTGEKALDLESITAGPCSAGKGQCLYLGDIGDNNRKRETIRVFRVQEPLPSVTQISVDMTILLKYPDQPHDAEAMMMHPETGVIYVVTKARGEDKETVVYKAAPPFRRDQPMMMERIGVVNLPDDAGLMLLIGRITGGDISPDGRRVVLCDYIRAYEAVLSDRAADFDRIWSKPFQEVDIGTRKQGEAVGYRHDGRAILATSEGSSSPLFQAERIR